MDSKRKLFVIMYRVVKKNDPLQFFANISVINNNFENKFYRLKDNSFLHTTAKFNQNIPTGTKVIALFVSLPH